jgi:hypothetical protein
MKVKYTTPSKRVEIELEVTTGKQAFEFVAAVQELFEEPACGKCKSEILHCVVREIQGNKYFSLSCAQCGAQLDFGQNKDGKGIFVKRYDKDKQPLPNNGWYHWKTKHQGDL